MTTLTEARDSIVTALEGAWPAAYPSVPVFYDNASVNDHDNKSEFLGCAIEFDDSNQANIGPSPLLRTYGMITLTLGVKAASGSRTSLQRADFLINLFRFSKKGGVVCKAPHPLPPSTVNGWFLTEIVVPFHFDG